MKIKFYSGLILIAILCLLALPVETLAHKDRLEHPQLGTVSLDFEKGREKVVFTFVGSSILSLVVKSGEVSYVCPASECAKFHDVRFESVNLLWNGSQKSLDTATYFYVRFDMGPKSSRAFGDLPYVHAVFRQGNFSESTIFEKLRNRLGN